MRFLPLLCAISLCAGVELPTIVRATPTAVQTYDLGATAPWMPVLWDTCTLTLPTDTSAVRLCAWLTTGTGLGVDSSDLIGLRDGHRLTVAGTTFTVAGITGTWNGVRNSTSQLTASINHAVAAADLLLLCRQLYYANLGGERSLVRRRIEVSVGAKVSGTWYYSLAMHLDLDITSVDQPPKLRLDALTVPQGGSVALTQLGWYDGRQLVDALSWHLGTPSPELWISGLDGGTRVDVTAALQYNQHDLSWFDAAQLRIETRAGLGTFTCPLIVTDGAASAPASCPITVSSASGELEILGDLPFVYTNPTEVRLLASRPDVQYQGCRTHPSIGGDGAVTAPFTVFIDGAEIRLVLDHFPDNASEVLGRAVFAAGDSNDFQLPYRIQRVPHRAN